MAQLLLCGLVANASHKECFVRILRFARVLGIRVPFCPSWHREPPSFLIGGALAAPSASPGRYALEVSLSRKCLRNPQVPCMAASCALLNGKDDPAADWAQTKF
ncbi:hypothetical protein CCR75_003777 [Bremia lactucae]|uniref:Uncharacterized protein n=1 Tax=Bremia lactucae TaxID=4779 RepID=A0A976NZE2_BRELC|nr:hypothetical protein CCR75_003777 [Bremia lactucae]